MKNNIGGRFYTQVIVNILYSTMIACLIEVFLITNIDNVGAKNSRDEVLITNYDWRNE